MNSAVGKERRQTDRGLGIEGAKVLTQTRNIARPYIMEFVRLRVGGFKQQMEAFTARVGSLMAVDR